MRIITQDNLITHPSWWHALDSTGETLQLMHVIIDDDKNETTVLLPIASFDNEETVQSLNEALVTALSYAKDGQKEFNVPLWEKENLA